MTLNVVGWLLDAGTEHERTLAGSAWVPSRGGTTNEPMVLRVDAESEIYRLRTALATAEAALADIGDSDREPGDDMAWCERRAALALPEVRAALTPNS